jgi:eukaryotic-like serine/threonine-protein kinase
VKARLDPGDLFAERFLVLGQLGSGAMGTVYRARDVESGEELALKLMHPALAEDAKSVHRFEREARAGMTIKSRHVARVIHTGLDAAIPWLAMEYAEGEHLRHFVERHWPLEPVVQTDLLCQVFTAMRAAHAAGVVHRDLKPDNIIVMGTPDAPLLKVLDFGIAKSLSSSTALQTAPGQGTPLWTAPEQMRADDVPHPRADVFALGLLTFFILTGRIYWKHAQGTSSMVELSMELVRAPIERPSVRVTELGIATPLPEGFDDWFLRCVTRDPMARYESAGPALGGLMQMLDRRAHERHEMWIPVYSDAFSGGVGITHDASDNGMLILARRELELGDAIEVRFSVPPGTQVQFVTQGTVVRSGPNSADPDGLWKVRVAIAFERPLPELRPLLASLARELQGN